MGIQHPGSSPLGSHRSTNRSSPSGLPLEPWIAGGCCLCLLIFVIAPSQFLFSLSYKNIPTGLVGGPFQGCQIVQLDSEMVTSSPVLCVRQRLPLQLYQRRGRNASLRECLTRSIPYDTKLFVLTTRPLGWSTSRPRLSTLRVTQFLSDPFCPFLSPFQVQTMSQAHHSEQVL
jgi:hypothetical protein